MTEDEKDFEIEKLKLEHKHEIEKLKVQIAHDHDLKSVDKNFQIYRDYSSFVNSHAESLERHFKDYAIQALKSIFILNGAAIIATLGLLGAIYGKPGAGLKPGLFVPAFGKFVLGEICVVLCMFVAYLNYSFHYHARAKPEALFNFMSKPGEDWPGVVGNEDRWKVNTTHQVAVALGILSMIFFVWGCVQLADEFYSIM